MNLTDFTKRLGAATLGLAAAVTGLATAALSAGLALTFVLLPLAHVVGRAAAVNLETATACAKYAATGEIKNCDSFSEMLKDIREEYFPSDTEERKNDTPPTPW